MEDSGKGFGLDLYQMEKVATSDLPTVASVYGDAAGSLQRARSALDGMPAVPEHFVHGPSGPVYGAYGRLHDAVFTILTDTGNNLDETAQSLHEAVQLYAETDRAAAAELQRLTEDRPTLKPE